LGWVGGFGADRLIAVVPAVSFFLFPFSFFFFKPWEWLVQVREFVLACSNLIIIFFGRFLRVAIIGIKKNLILFIYVFIY